MSQKIEHLVADAAAFISNAPLRDLAGRVYTVPEVIAESCDKETRRRLKAFPPELTYKEPSSESMKFVISFAKQTGDYGSLSSVDLKVLALTCDLVKQFEGDAAIKKEPGSKPAFVFGRPAGQSDGVMGSQKHYGEGDCLPSDMITEVSDEEEEEEDEETASMDSENVTQDDNATSQSESTKCGGQEVQKDSSEPGTSENANITAANDEEDNTEEELDEDEEEEDDEDDDDEGWITPSNIAAVKRSMGVESAEDKPVCVGCLTTDFAIQNVLVQMGLHVIAVDGKLIKQVKTYVKRCFGCMKITKNTSKQFCPHCGNKTLRRLATSLGEDGTMRYHLAKSYTSRIRGTKYSLPKPQGGKHALNPMLSADQPHPDQRLSKKALQRFDIMSKDIVEGSSPFKMNDVTSRSAQLGLNHHTPQWAKRNPNENNRKGKTRRKK